MTPLAKFYAQFLPDRLVWCAVMLTYTLGLIVLAFFGRDAGTDIIYIDLE